MEPVKYSPSVIGFGAYLILQLMLATEENQEIGFQGGKICLFRQFAL